MNSDQLLNALADCAQASTHEPDAETINAAAEYIMQLERENHNQDLTIDEKNERISQLEAQLAASEREAYKAGYEKAIRWARTVISEAALFTQDKETIRSILDALKK